MLFNSFSFLLFFLVVYLLYLFLNHKGQNRLLLVASYTFYGFWDWRFLGLILFSTGIDYISALKIEQSEHVQSRKCFLLLSVVTNLGMLGFFKYFNFFSESFQGLVSLFGWSPGVTTLNVVLPVGISFYTFQSMSYTVDVYRREFKAVRSFESFALFVAYFPQLVAGPIERAKRLIPQILSPRKISRTQIEEGSYLIFWGLFQKVFVADNLAKIVDPLFSSQAPYVGASVLIVAYAFILQVFCDFAGYSNMARGLSKLMGFELMINFKFPYLSTNPQEFWGRWHISLSHWFRDYVFYPLGGWRSATGAAFRSILITFFLAGLWHGAAWTFVFWGIYHALIIMAHYLLRPILRVITQRTSGALKQVWFMFRVLAFFHLFTLSGLFFRAGSVGQAFQMIESLFFRFNFRGDFVIVDAVNLLFFSWLLVMIQVVEFQKKDVVAPLKWPPVFRGLFYALCFYLLILWGSDYGKAFIYFVF